MAPPDLEDTEYLVWPFRRQLIDETAPADERTARPARPAPPVPPPAPAAPRRRGALALLLVALPVCFAVFVAAAAGSAAFTGADEVAAPQLAQPAAGAAPRPAAASKPRPRPAAFVPDVRDLRPAAALRSLRSHRFLPVLRYRRAATPGRVLAQRPAAGTEVARPGRVLVVVGVRGTPKPAPVAAQTAGAVVASVVGLDRRAAAQALLAAGYGVRIYGVRSEQPLDRVVAQSPRAGTRLAAGAYVRIDVSAG